MSKLTLQQRLDSNLRDALERAGIFAEAAKILPFSLLSSARLRGVIRATGMLGDLAGETAEIGCNAGGTSRLIALLNGGRRHWACDTFEGLVDVGQQDSSERIINGAFKNHVATFAGASERLADLKHVRVVQGYLPNDAPPEMLAAQYALVHIDVDTYKSIHSCFAFFAPRMLQGGFLIMDDVIGRGTEGGKLAWREIVARSGDSFETVETNDPQVIVRIK